MGVQLLEELRDKILPVLLPCGERCVALPGSEDAG